MALFTKLIAFHSQMKLDEISLCDILQATVRSSTLSLFPNCTKVHTARLELENWQPFDNFYGFPKDAFGTLIFGITMEAKRVVVSVEVVEDHGDEVGQEHSCMKQAETHIWDRYFYSWAPIP